MTTEGSAVQGGPVEHAGKMVDEAKALTGGISQKASALATELSLNRGVYDAINGLDVGRADSETKYYVQRTLRDFRLAGVDKDEATRKRIQELRDELVLVGQDFDRNIRTDVRTVTASNAGELDGLPADYIARHKPDANGASCTRLPKHKPPAPQVSW